MKKLIFILFIAPLSVWGQIVKSSGEDMQATISTIDWDKVKPCIQCPLTLSNSGARTLSGVFTSEKKDSSILRIKQLEKLVENQNAEIVCLKRTQEILTEQLKIMRELTSDCLDALPSTRVKIKKN